MSLSQVNMVSLEELVSRDHIYRRFDALWNVKKTEASLKSVETERNYKGYGILRLFKCLLLQFLEDLSDRELARFLEENTAAKWFCRFDLAEKTPHYSVFSRLRERIGTNLLAKLFADLRDQLQTQGYMNEVFTLVDASHLISKATLWQERDKAIKKKYDQLNNQVLPKVAKDKQARIGCKGKKKYWYGYKKHVSVDMQRGLINKVAVTPANVTDAQGLKHVCPKQGGIYADKGYCVKPAKQAAAKRNCHLAAIKWKTMKGKHRDQDRWYTHLRSPYERVFAHTNKRVRYIGIERNQFTAFMQAICFNLKR